MSILLGAYSPAVGIDAEDNSPTQGTTLPDSVIRLYFFQSAGSPNLLWLEFSKLDFAKGAPVKPVPGMTPP